MIKRPAVVKASVWLAMFLPAFVSRADDVARVTVPVSSVALYPDVGIAVKFPVGTELVWHESASTNYIWPHQIPPGNWRRTEIAWVPNDPSPDEALLPRARSAIADRKNPIRLIGEPRLIQVNGLDFVEARFQSPQKAGACKSEWEAVRFYFVTGYGKLGYLQFSGFDLPGAEELATSICPIQP